MEIHLKSLLQGAREASGTVVIIDVYRAFTTAAVAFQRDAKKIFFVTRIEDALALRRRGVCDLCAGEVGGIRPEGFDFGNSPFQLNRADVAGKTLCLSTRAGTTGVEAAGRADRIYAASLTVADATAQAIRNRNPDTVTLVAMGWEGRGRTDEDELCALYLRNLLLGCTPDPDAVCSLVRSAAESRKFDDPGQPHFHPGDRDLALRIDSVPFAINVTPEDGLLVARPEPV